MGSDLRERDGAPGRIRTCDTRFRRAVLYPLSYEGGGVTNEVGECPQPLVVRQAGYPTPPLRPQPDRPHHLLG